MVVTATDWSNFFDLRIHEDAQPEMRELAVAIKLARQNSQPKHVGANRWHLPYVEAARVQNIEELKLISAARCARVSYKTHDGLDPDPLADLGLAERLMGPPFHASPFEHQATPAAGRHANFNGWSSYRRELEQ